MLTPIPILDEPFYRTGLAQIGFCHGCNFGTFLWQIE